jgi:hypothetical protein
MAWIGVDPLGAMPWTSSGEQCVFAMTSEIMIQNVVQFVWDGTCTHSNVYTKPDGIPNFKPIA